MSLKLSLCFALMVSAQVCLAGPTTTVAPLAIPSFTEILATAQKSVADATAHVQQMLGLPEIKNVDQVVQALKNSSATFSKQVNDVITSVKVDVDPNAKAAAAAFQKFFAEVNKTTEEFRKKIPELQVSDLEKTWSKSLNAIVEEGSKLKTALEKEAPHAQDSLTKAVQTILESATKTANNFANEVHEVVGHDKHPDHKNHHKA